MKPHQNTASGRGSWGLRRPREPRPLYRALRAATRLGMRAYYRTVEVTGGGQIDTGQPTILASNHPNSIVDPLLLGLFERRQVAFCARDGLFEVPLFGRLLRAVGAIPIARPGDHRGAGVDNHDAFAAARAVLEGGGVISIFPEGHTHDRLKIHKAKTGIARIALDAEAAQPEGIGVRIVPVGLNYLVRQAFRSDVHVAFGEPIEVSAYRELNGRDHRAAVRALTDRVEQALRDLAIHIDQVEDERIIAQVTSIIVDIRAEQGLDEGGQTPAERTALVRRVVDAYRWLEVRDPEQTAHLRRRLQRYLEERRALGLGGDSAALQHRSERQRGHADRWRARRRFFVLGAPLAAWGVAQGALPYAALRGVLELIRPRKDRQALTKFIAGAVIYSGFWAGQTAAVSVLLGPGPGGAYGVLLPVATLFALRYLTEARLHRLTRGGLRAVLQHGQRLEALRAERAALKDDLAALRERYLDRHSGGGGSARARGDVAVASSWVAEQPG